MSETELARAERRLEEARARVQALKNREAQKQRKLDTRRKVILGGALVDLAERDDKALAMVERLLRNLSRDVDRNAFEGWEVRGVGEREAQASRSPEDSREAAPGSDGAREGSGGSRGAAGETGGAEETAGGSGGPEEAGDSAGGPEETSRPARRSPFVKPPRRENAGAHRDDVRAGRTTEEIAADLTALRGRSFGQ